MDSYKTVASRGSDEFIVKKSRFIGHVCPVKTPEEAIEFINEINPEYSIISVGKNNRYGHPNKEVLDALEESKIYRTDQNGSIMFKINNNKLKIETCSP